MKSLLATAAILLASLLSVPVHAEDVAGTQVGAGPAVPSTTEAPGFYG